MLPLLALSAVAEYYRLSWKPPMTVSLLAANTLVYLRPAFIDPVIPHISEVWFNPHLILKVISSMQALMTEESNDANSDSFLLDDDASIPFSIDDISSSMQEKDFVGIKPAKELFD